ncbi:MAG TPA: LEA type 2 family protein [Kofleriaceae bacterium]
MQSTLRSILVLVAWLPVFGCSIFLRSMERPEVRVRDVSVASAGLTGVSGELKLDITNPNRVGIPLSGIDWQLSIGGARAATGRALLSQTIPARGVVPITTSLAIDARDAIAVASALVGGTRDYQVTATVHFSTAVGPLDVAVRHAGTISGSGFGLL